MNDLCRRRLYINDLATAPPIHRTSPSFSSLNRPAPPSLTFGIRTAQGRDTTTIAGSIPSPQTLVIFMSGLAVAFLAVLNLPPAFEPLYSAII